MPSSTEFVGVGDIASLQAFVTSIVSLKLPNALQSVSEFSGCLILKLQTQALNPKLRFP